MSAKLSDYVKTYYPDSKSDLFAVFIEKCKQNGISFYLCPVRRNEAFYGSTDNIIASGAIPLFNMTPESALAKIKLINNIDGLSEKDSLYYEEF